MKIVIIEDQTMFRGIVLQLCRTHLERASIEEAGTGQTGLELCRTSSPDVVLLDLDLPDANGLDLIGPVHAAAPGSRVIVLSSHTEEYMLHRCLQADVEGFVDKNDEPPEAVIEAIKAVSSGRPYFSPAVGRLKAHLRSDPTAFTKLLSPHEQTLLGLFGQGLSNEAIGERMGTSPNTIRNHRRNIMAKLGIPSTPELMRYAVKKGFTRIRSDVA